MSVVEDLEGTWKAINSALDDAGKAVFPGLPNVSARADWPGSEWRRFLDVADQVGVTIIYCESARIDDEEIAHFREQMFEQVRLRRPALVDPGPEREPSPDELSILAELQRHQGELFEITIGFANGGVMHLWTGEAPWWCALLARATRVREQQTEDDRSQFERDERDAGVLAEKAEKENWALRAAEDRRFLASTSRSARSKVLCQVVPELKRCMDGTYGWTGRQFATDLLIHAEILVNAEVKPRRTRQALAELDSLFAEIAQDPEWQVARTKHTRAAVANRFIKAKYGFAMPTVTEQLAITRANH